MKTSIFIKTDRKNISFIHWTFEACENLAIMTMVDEEKNISEVITTPEQIDEVKKVLRSFDFLVTIVKED